MNATPLEWIKAASMPWQVFYPFVAEQVKVYLSDKPEYDLTRTMTTDDLVKRAAPVNLLNPKTTTRVYKALNALADHELKDWWQPGVPKSILGGSKQIIPKRWRAPAGPVKERPSLWVPLIPPPTRYHWSSDAVGVTAHPEGAYVLFSDWFKLYQMLQRAPEDATATPVQP